MSYVFAACGAEWKVLIHIFVWVFRSVVSVTHAREDGSRHGK
jgi:hypothetical protein